MIEIPLANDQDLLPVEAAALESTVRSILTDAGYSAGMVSLAVVDDPTIHALNSRFLEHDYPTDVLSFPLADDGQRLEGEIVVSAETAIANAEAYGWPAGNELLLYVVHGALHLIGYRDKTEEEAAEMRAAEAKYLRQNGVQPPAPLVEAEGANPK